MVVVDPEKYVLIINASGKKLDSEALKKVTENNSLLGVVVNLRLKIYT